MKSVIILIIAFVLLIPIPIFAPSHPEYVGFEKPLKQILIGIMPEDVKCNEERILMIRHNGSPACVKPVTAEKFEQRGLGTVPPPCCKKLHTGTSLEPNESTNIKSPECHGTARCISGTVTTVIDGDTIKIDGQSIRFALASAPELNEPGGIEAKNFIETICSVGSMATVDEDDKQAEGSYGRILGVIYCNGFNLNADLLDIGHGYLISSFCDKSEFTTENWAQKHGCSTNPVSESKVSEYLENRCHQDYPYIWSDGLCYDIPEPIYEEKSLKCDPSYPDFCIPPPPPDLDCGDISQKRFTVLQPDPHRFDGDKDGIGCES